MALGSTITQVTDSGLKPGITFPSLVSSGVVTATNFKTGTTNVHNAGIEIAGINVLGGDTKIGTAATVWRDGGALFSGIVSATSFVGDISNATGAAAGLGTALSQTQTNPLNKIYYTDSILSVGSTITINPPSSASAAYTQYTDIVADGADIIVADGDDFIPDVLGISTDTIPSYSGSGGRVRAGKFTNTSANGAPTAPNGWIVTGVSTATTFKGAIDASTGAFSGNVTIDGNLGVAGTITYEDVARVDATGISTFREGFGVGPLAGIALTAYKDGSIRTSGVITATSYYGSGANLTGISAGLTTDTQDNTIGGALAGAALQNGAINNTLIGYKAGTAITTGDKNVALGHDTLTVGTTAERNVVVGTEAGKVLTAKQNTIVGTMAGIAVSDGEANTLLGDQAGYNLTTGDKNIIIGWQATPSAVGVDHEITLGSTNITKLRVPGINFVLKDNGGTPSVGQVLTADGSGEGYWAAAGGGITQVDFWRLTANLQANQLPIASNLARVNTYGFDNNAKIGSGMTQSSGVWTFPATGLYWVRGFCNVYSANHSQTNTLQIRYTADGGSNWASASIGAQGIYDYGIDSFGYISVDAMIDVTSTSNIKVAFNFGAGQGGEYIQGHSVYTYTGFIFIRLGDT